jgi:RNA polymerase sigma-70 factor (ECF subfamily)
LVSGKPEPAGDVVALEQAQIARAQAGDRRMLEALLARHSDALFSRVILPRVGDRATAEDILKMTLVAAIEHLGSFRWQQRSIYHWLRQVAVNKVIDHHRATKRGRDLAATLAREADLRADAPPGPEAALIASEEQRLNRERIGGALARINPRYRMAIELRLIEELPRETCAERLDVTVSTFDVLLFRAIRAFRNAFGER